MLKHMTTHRVVKACDVDVFVSVCVCVCVCVLQIQPSSNYLKAVGTKSIPDYDCGARAGKLTVPNLNLGYPEELGGR